jgi:hypothetical protein
LAFFHINSNSSAISQENSRKVQFNKGKGDKKGRSEEDDEDRQRRKE